MRTFGYLVAGSALVALAGQSAAAAPRAPRAEPATPQTPCLFAKTTDQVFEYRNMQATAFKRGDTRYVAVTGCLVSTVPEKIRSVSVSFVALGPNGETISGSNGQQMMTPTQTVGFWSTKTPAWTVPAAAELAIDKAAGEAKATWIEVTVFWQERSGQPHREVYLLGTEPRPLLGEAPKEPAEGERAPFPPEEERADCKLEGTRPRFTVGQVQLRLGQAGTEPVAYYMADVKVPGHAEMTRAWATVTAFDRYGNFLGADGGVVGGVVGMPPPPTTQLPEGFRLRTADFARVSNRTLMTFQWYDKVGCRWTENHFVDAVRMN